MTVGGNGLIDCELSTEVSADSAFMSVCGPEMCVHMDSTEPVHKHVHVPDQ